MQQKLTILGLTRRQGISKKTGNEYDMANVNTMQPNRGRDSNHIAAGYKSVEMGLPPSIVSQFTNERFPFEVLADVELRDDGKLEIIAMEKTNSKASSATA